MKSSKKERDLSHYKSVKEADDLYEKKQYSESNLILEKAVSEFRKAKDTSDFLYPSIYCKMALNHMGLKEFKKARALFMKAFSISEPSNEVFLYEYFEHINLNYSNLSENDSLFYDSLISQSSSYVSLYTPIDTMEFTNEFSGTIKIPLTKAHHYKDEVITLYRIEKDENGLIAFHKVGEGSEIEGAPKYTSYKFVASDTSQKINFKTHSYQIVSQTFAPISEDDMLAMAFVKNIRFRGSFGEIPLSYKMVITKDFQFYRNYVYQMFQSTLRDVYDFSKDNDDFKMLRDSISEGFYSGNTILDLLKTTGKKDLDLFFRYTNDYPVGYWGEIGYFPDYFVSWLMKKSPTSVEHLSEQIIEEHKSGNKINFSKYEYWMNERKIFKYWEEEIERQNDLNNFLEVLTIQETQEAYAIYKNDSNLHYQIQLQKVETLIELDQKNIARNLLDSCKSFFKKMNDLGSLEETKVKISDLEQADQIEIFVQNPHQSYFKMVHHPNGKYFYSAGWDGTLKKWENKSGRIIQNKTTDHDFLKDIQISGDGKYLVTFDEFGLINIYESKYLKNVYSVKKGDYLTDVDINFDGRWIAYLNGDSNTYLIKWQDSDSNHILSKHKNPVSSIKFYKDRNYLLTGGRDSMIYQWDIDKMENIGWFHEGSQVYSISISNNGVAFSTVCSDTMVSLWEISETRRIGRIPTNFNTIGSTSYFAAPSYSHDNKHMAMMSKKGSYLIISLADYYYKGFVNSDKINVYQLAFHPTKSILYTIDSYYQIKKIDVRGYHRKKTNSLRHTYFVTSNTMMYKTEFSYDGSILNTITMDPDKTGLLAFDLKNGRSNYISTETYNLQKEYNGKRSVTNLSNQLLLEGEDGTFEKFINLPKSLNLYTINFIDKVVYGMDADSNLISYSYHNNTILDSIPISKLIKNCKTVINLYFVPSTKSILLATKSNKVFNLKIRNSRVVHTYDSIVLPSRILNLASNLNNTYFVFSTDSFICVHNSKSLKIEHQIRLKSDEIDEYISSTAISDDGKKIAFGNKEFKCIIYDLANKDTIAVSKAFSWYIFSINFNPKKPVVAIASIGNYIHLFDYNSKKGLMDIYPRKNGSSISIIDDKYYWAPKNALSGITFKKGRKVYPVESFDYYFNRPDIVLEKSPFVDQIYLNAVQMAVNKRGVKKFDQIGNSIPNILIKNRNSIDEIIFTQKLNLLIQTSDLNSPVNKIFISVNGVPVFGKKGYKIDPLKEQINSLDILLNRGDNRISIWCENEKNISSLKENIIINYRPQKIKKPNLYFIGISVSEYMDDEYNLRYAVKDARDLLATFLSNKNRYDEIFVDTLFNSNAIRSNLNRVHQLLLKSKPEDKVVVFISGHGLLDKNYNFFFASYDCNFEQPETKGISYSSIESLFDGIHARQRLLLMDACHSGEVDKSEIVKTENPDQPKKGAKGIYSYSYRGAKIKNTKGQIGLENSFELMKELFADIGENGIQVISAAAGDSYALESDKWGNGVFTSSIIKAIQTQEADVDKNGYIKVSELRQYVIQEVFELTNGKQKPTVRNENIEYDFSVW